MNSNLHFKFKGIDENNQDINLNDLGKSLIGLDSLIRKLIKITRVQGDILINATNDRDGSIIVDALIEIKTSFDQLPFENIEHFYEFIKIASEFAQDKAAFLLNEISTIYKSSNEYFSKHPLDLTLLAAAVASLIKYAKHHKKEKNLIHSKLPKRIAEELFHLIRKHAFKQALGPIIEDKIESMEVSPYRDFKRSVKIDQDNFHEYLTKEDQILPHLINGTKHNLLGDITSLKSTRGDSFTFSFRYKNKIYNLDLLPPEGVSTKQYTKYYKENVIIRTEIFRTSMYKKPKLNLIDINLYQNVLDFNTTT